MSFGSLIFLLLIVGSFLAMFSMHRGGGHSHGGLGGGCGGHSGHDGHGGRSDEDVPDAEHSGHEQRKPLLGPPGTKSGQPVSAAAEPRRHRGC